MSNGEQPCALIMAGGTGGHVFPALAVAKKLLARDWRVEWLGTPRGIENDVVPAAGIHLNKVEMVGVRGKSLTTWIALPWRLTTALRQAMAIVRKTNPCVVLGFGGFASAPGGLAARMLRKPLVIHEQNAVAGSANRMLAKIAARRLEAFPGSLPNAMLVGNPVREEIAAIPTPETRLARKTEKPRLLILGGSLGAQKLNQLVPEAVAQLASELSLDIWHQCGRNHVDATHENYRRHGIAAKVEPFLDDMGAAYYWADLVLCRAGALTVSEITAAGVAALMVPYPHAIDDHQTHNARWLSDNTAGVMKAETTLTATALADELRALFGDLQRLRTFAGNARRLAKPHAAEQVAEICVEVANV